VRRITLLGAIAALTGVVVTGTATGMSTPKLNGTVGPGFTIMLKSKGKKVKVLNAGKYTFVVADKSSIHNFVLEKEKGGKFEKQITTVPATGTKTVTISLTKGQWKYYCVPHESTMHGEFKVM
jgi:Copper binding proteins, plastocyanin/azurin family